IVILASDDVDVYRNTIHGSLSVGVSISSWCTQSGGTEKCTPTAQYDGFVDRACIHDNEFMGNGTAAEGPLAPALPPRVEDIIWDGFPNPGAPTASASRPSIRNNRSDQMMHEFRNYNFPSMLMDQTTDLAP